MMGRFLAGVGVYLALGVLAIAVIIARGDGPHPYIASVYPYNGDRFWPGGTAQITFSQAMDQASVERALQVSPGSQGQGAWFGNTLNLQPVGDWRPNVVYHVALVGKVTDDQSRPLQTPVFLSFRVHHVQRLGVCTWRGVANVCERLGKTVHVLTHSRQPVLQYALSPDGSLLAYTSRDGTGLPHLYVIQVDGTALRQLTAGRQYADRQPQWAPGDSNSITYRRAPVTWIGRQYRLGRPRIWNVNIDGTHNTQF